MNLYKSTKKQLIAEIKRLRKIEEIRDHLYEEIKRRDKAKEKYQEMEKEVFLDAIAIAINYKDWDDFWHQQSIRTDYDHFWSERKADEIQKRISYLQGTLPYPVLEAWKEDLKKILTLEEYANTKEWKQ